METRPLLLIYVFPVLLVFALAEALLYRRIRKKPFAWRASLASLLVAVGYQISNLVGFQLTGGAFLWLYQFAPVHYAMDRWYHWLLLFLGLEFFYYWFHRAGHEIRWFWATHSVHHSPEEINRGCATCRAAPKGFLDLPRSPVILRRLWIDALSTNESSPVGRWQTQGNELPQFKEKHATQESKNRTHRCRTNWR